MADNDKIWKKFLSKHWREFSLFLVIGIILVIAAIYVLKWFIGYAQTEEIVPLLLGEWSMGYLVTFILHLIFWEFVYVGIPALVIFAAIYGLWWRRLPDAEKKEYRKGNLFGKHSKRKDGEGAVSFLVFIFFVLKVYMDNNWGKEFATWEFEYLVISCLTAFLWVAIVFGIPILIGGIWYLHSKMNKSS